MAMLRIRFYLLPEHALSKSKLYNSATIAIKMDFGPVKCEEKACNEWMDYDNCQTNEFDPDTRLIDSSNIPVDKEECSFVSQENNVPHYKHTTTNKVGKLPVILMNPCIRKIERYVYLHSHQKVLSRNV